MRMKMSPIVSKRNHCSSAETLAEDAIHHFSGSMQAEDFRRALVHYTEHVIRQVAWDFAKGAERGVRQVANLLCDPEYYATLRERRARWRRQSEQQYLAQEQERLERRVCPTQEQLAEEVARLEDRIPREEALLAAMRERLAHLKNLKPRLVRMTTEKPR